MRTLWLAILGVWVAVQAVAVSTARPEARRFLQPVGVAPRRAGDPTQGSDLAALKTVDLIARYHRLQAARSISDRLLGIPTATFEALDAPGVRAEYLRELWRRGESSWVRAECSHLIARFRDLTLHDQVNLVLTLGAIDESWTSDALVTLLGGPDGRSWAGLHAAAFLEERFQHRFEPPPERVNANAGAAFDRWRQGWLSWHDQHHGKGKAP